MKTINLNSDLPEFHEYFGNVLNKKYGVLVWQVDPASQKRTIFHSHISSYEENEETLSFNTVNDGAYEFEAHALYFYIENTMSIFKSEQISIQNNFLSVKYPDELKFLDEMEDDKLKAVFSAIDPDYVKVPPTFHEIQSSKEKGYSFLSGSAPEKKGPEWNRVDGSGRTSNISTHMVGKMNQSSHDNDIFEKELSFVTLDEEDLKFQDDREAPRARPPEGKMVLVQKRDGTGPQESLPLFDLSRGGMGFMVFSQDAYSKGDIIDVKGFDTSKFDAPMIAIIRSVREADEMGIQYKIGLQFISEEQANESA